MQNAGKDRDRDRDAEMKESTPVTSWTVAADQEGIRLDAFVRLCLPHLSLSEARRAIDEKAFWVNERPGKKGDRLLSGDLLTLRGSAGWLAESPLPAADLEVSILYEDGFILALDKPAGMATHGRSGGGRNTLANFLAAVRPSLCAAGKSPWESGMVHRLDQETSGVVLAAKDRRSFENLRSQFRLRLVKKRYWALVWGRPKREGIIAYPLIHDPAERKKMKALREKERRRNRQREWQASTRFRALGHSGELSLLEVTIETGVTHQIRAHLQAIGHPLAGDRLYGDPLYARDRADPFRLRRHFLHAFYLGFLHPSTGREMAIESPLPTELKSILDSLKIGF